MQISAGAGIADGTLNFIKLDPQSKAALNYGIITGVQMWLRNLIAGTVTYSKNYKDVWGDAYIDADGRSNSLRSFSTTFDTNKMKIGSDISGTSSTSSIGNTSYGNTTAKSGVYFIPLANVNITAIVKTSNCTATKAYVYEVTRFNLTEILAATDFSTNTATCNINLSAGKCYFICVDKAGASYAHTRTENYTKTTSNFGYWVLPAEQTEPTFAGCIASITGSVTTQNKGIIYHTIPTGTFPATISNACFKAYLEDYETGASVSFRLYNATTGDSGSFADGDIVSFSSFDAEPTVLEITLTPKTGGTAGYPSIKGFGGVAW